MRPRRQYRLLQAAFIFALVGVAFWGSYVGYRASDYPIQAKTHQHTLEVDFPSAVWHWLAHDAAGFFTAGLCVVTALLAWFTYALYKTTAGLATETREAAAAALVASTTSTKLAREEFNATHRPRIKIHSITFVRRNPDGPVDEEVIASSVYYASFGEQEAVIDSIRYRFGQLRVPLESGLEMTERAQGPGTPIMGGMRGWFGVSAEEAVKTAKLSSDELSKFFFMGQIFYRGPQPDGIIRELGFCRVLECGPNFCRWARHDNEEYEYSY